ncbi:MAG: SGNH/GDSL hydrolase family protein [Acidimicrobiia bacterium]|nr:SGNH/GDSL hydrolase family protein [Acidimicrobiia bacterium]
MTSKLGGNSELRVACLGGSDLPTVIEERFPKLVAEEFPDVTVVMVGAPVESSRRLLEMVRSEDAVFQPAPDIVVLSVQPDVVSELDPAEFRTNMLEVIGTIKARYDARIMAFNASTFDPEDTTTTFFKIDSPYPLRIHELDLEIMRLSIDEGISIIDVDRLMAELGAGKHVPKVMELSPRAQDVVAEEFMRVVKDYGFFENRPLLAQIGKKAS